MKYIKQQKNSGFTPIPINKESQKANQVNKSSNEHRNRFQLVSGFTIVEMLIAVFIFTLSLAALMAIASKGLKVANQAQKQVVAEYLALEGIEVVRNIRDAAFIRLNNTTDWLSIFNQDNCLSDQYQGDNNGCEVRFNGNQITLHPCENCKVYYSESNSMYKQGSVGATYVESPYTRRIELTNVIGNANEIIVTVTVTWDGGEVVYTEDLFLWLL